MKTEEKRHGRRVNRLEARDTDRTGWERATAMVWDLDSGLREMGVEARERQRWERGWECRGGAVQLEERTISSVHPAEGLGPCWWH